MKATIRPMFLRWHGLLAAAALSSLAQGALTTTIEFTAAEGYVNGQLAGQDNWANVTQWAVDTSGGGSATITADGFRTLARTADPGATLNLTVGESVTLRTMIQLSGTLVTPAANSEVMRFGIGTTAITASYVRLYFTTDGNITLFNSDVLEGVGFSIADNGNARLAIDTTYTVGAGNWGSSTTHELINLDTNTSAGTGTRAWGEAVPSMWNLVTGTGDVGSYRHTSWSKANTGIDSITMLSTDVVAVPEPGVMGLLLFGSGVVGLLRRRRVS